MKSHARHFNPDIPSAARPHSSGPAARQQRWRAAETEPQTLDPHGTHILLDTLILYIDLLRRSPEYLILAAFCQQTTAVTVRCQQWCRTALCCKCCVISGLCAADVLADGDTPTLQHCCCEKLNFLNFPSI